MNNETIAQRIQHLTNQVNLTYQLMRDERQQLAEWEEEQDFSILGEVELLTSKLQGYSGQLLGERIQDFESIVVALKKTNPFEIDDVSNWYVAFGDRFPQVSRYIEQLDYLRFLLIEYSTQLTTQVVA